MKSENYSALERAITALEYRANRLEEVIKDRPGAAVSSIMFEGVKNDRIAILALTGMARQLSEETNAKKEGKYSTWQVQGITDDGIWIHDKTLTTPKGVGFWVTSILAKGETSKLTITSQK